MPDDEDSIVSETSKTNLSGLIGTIDIFTGASDGQKVSDFLDSIEDIAELASWSDVEQIAVARLRMRQYAKEWLRANPEVKKLKVWALFREKLVREFAPTRVPVQAAQSFANCYQKVGETVRQYETRLKMAGMATLKLSADEDANKVRLEMLQDILFSQFCAGINKNLQRYILSSSATTFSQAVEVAIKEENNEKLLGKRSATVNAVFTERGPPSRTNTDRRNVPNTKQQGQRNRGNKNFSFNSNFNVDRKQTRCYNCNSLGHILKFCPSKSVSTCFNCGKPNHFAKNCPDKQHQGNGNNLPAIPRAGRGQ
jgi:hypothetical protein